MLDLTQCIQNAHPQARHDLIKRFNQMVEDYKLDHWVPNPQTGCDAFFIAPEVVEQVGYSRGHATHTFNRIVDSSSMEPRPVSLKLVGLPLQRFRRLLREHRGISMPVSSLRVVNWSAVYEFIDQSRPRSPRLQPWSSEEEIQTDILMLSTLSPHPFTREWTVENTLDNRTRTRRFDLVRRLPHLTQVVEIKLHILTQEDVSITLGERGYHHLARQAFQSGVPLSFIFLAPGISPEAARLLEMMPGISFLSIQEMRDQLYQECQEHTPASGRWFLERQKGNFPRLWSV